MGRKAFFALLASLVSCSVIRGQDVSWSQFFANQLYLNPAYAGTSGGARIGLNYRNQWPGITSKFESYSFAADIYNPVFNGGLGFLVNSNVEGEGFLRNTRIGLIQSFERVMPHFVRFRAGYEVSFCQTSIDWSRLQFTDNLDPVLGSVYPTQAIAPGGGTRNYMDFGAGFMFDFMKIKIGTIHIGNTLGLNMAHLMEPNESIMGARTQLPRKYVIHYTMFIPLKEDRMHNDYVYLLPNVVYEQQANFSTTNIGFYVSKNPLLAGIWYRKKQLFQVKDQDALILNIGVKGSLGELIDYKLGYSYDFTINNLSNNTLGAHEVSLIMEFKNATLLGTKGRKPKHAHNKTAECEDFGNHTKIF
jgi:type IX secretion system PorP/SprF family membrane protein